LLAILPRLDSSRQHDFSWRDAHLRIDFQYSATVEPQQPPKIELSEPLSFKKPECNGILLSDRNIDVVNPMNPEIRHTRVQQTRGHPFQQSDALGEPQAIEYCPLRDFLCEPISTRRSRLLFHDPRSATLDRTIASFGLQNSCKSGQTRFCKFPLSHLHRVVPRAQSNFPIFLYFSVFLGVNLLIWSYRKQWTR